LSAFAGRKRPTLVLTYPNPSAAASLNSTGGANRGRSRSVVRSGPPQTARIERQGLLGQLAQTIGIAPPSDRLCLANSIRPRLTGFSDHHDTIGKRPIRSRASATLGRNGIGRGDFLETPAATSNSFPPAVTPFG
jgi:hypothetical protein